MSIETRQLTQEEADNRTMLDHAFRQAPLDADVAKRVHERAEAVRARLPLMNVAVDLIREIREE